MELEYLCLFRNIFFSTVDPELTEMGLSIRSSSLHNESIDYKVMKVAIDLGENYTQNIETDEIPLSVSSGMLTFLPTHRFILQILFVINWQYLLEI